MTGSSISLPVANVGSFDVIVVGGGLAGVCAALAAAREGASTLLAEAMPFIGGNAVIGLPFSSFRAHQSQHIIVAGLAGEILSRLRHRGGVVVEANAADWIPVDCELLQLEITHMIQEAGVSLLTHSPLLAVDCDANHITSAVFYSKETTLRYEGSTFIDATGDAQLAFLAGLPTPVGRERDNLTQPMSLTFSLGGIETERVPPWNEIQKCWDSLRAAGIAWMNPRSGPALSDPLPVPNRPGVYSFNVTRILTEKGTDNRLLSEAEIEGRLQVEEFVEKFLRPHIPGYERCHLTQIGPRIGVRETRRIKGLYELQREDLVKQIRFDDAIACNSYPVDIHSPDGGGTQYEHTSLPPGGYYTIPYRSLVARDATNLLACGRCLSATHEALAAVRILSASMATGEAAGLAAALALQLGVPPAKVDVPTLRNALRSRGAIVE